MINLYFAKLKSGAVIPSKEDEDAGYDIYPCFEESFIEIKPGEIRLIPTGIASAFSADYVLQINERSSSGSKGLAIRAGIIDSGYRGEIFIAVNNTISKPIIIAKEDFINNLDSQLNLIWPYEKAIAQGLLLPVPKTNVIELSLEDLQKIDSKRGDSALGASGK
jgi:dUTP pyrophosphatase